MGRTQRIRSRRKNKSITNYLSSDAGTIDFIKWMTKNGWVDISKLRIAEFSNTSRGVLSLHKIKQHDLLMEVPLDIMVTYKTLSESELLFLYINNCTSQLTIHDLLSIFVIIEFHKSKTSEWYSYLSYLPLMDQIYLPWFCSDEETSHFPNELRSSIYECKQTLEESWGRISTINSNICPHCNKNVKDILNKDVYNWAYTIVNTRAVYIDPDEIRKMSTKSLENILSDEPTMALCPYIDMFNHSSSASVKAVLKPDGNVPKYCLITENNFGSYEEIFISYGAHDNKKLLCQYGFILEENQFDTIEYDLKEIINVCKINTSSRQYKFLCDHGFNSDINVSSIKFSFNMAAVLFVLSHSNEQDWSMRVYTSVFTKEQLKLMYGLAEILLKWKLKQYEEELENITRIVTVYSCHFQLCLNYLRYRINFIRKIIDVK